MNWNKKSFLFVLMVSILLASMLAAAGCGDDGSGTGKKKPPDPNAPSEAIRKFLEVAGGDCNAAMANFSMSPGINASVLSDCQKKVQSGHQLLSFEVDEEEISGDTAKVRYRAAWKTGSSTADVTGGFGLTKVNGVWKITSYLPPPEP